MTERISGYRVLWRRMGSEGHVRVHVLVSRPLKSKIESAAKMNNRSVMAETRAALEWYYSDILGMK